MKQAQHEALAEFRLHKPEIGVLNWLGDAEFPKGKS
jgi:hypothetical protein